MQFGLTDTQMLTRNAAREYFAAEYPPAVVRRLAETATAHDPELWRQAAAQGWCAMTIPEAYGGMGLGLVEIAAAMEEVGRVLAPGPLLAHLTELHRQVKAGAFGRRNDRRRRLGQG